MGLVAGPGADEAAARAATRARAWKRETGAGEEGGRNLRLSLPSSLYRSLYPLPPTSEERAVVRTAIMAQGKCRISIINDFA